MEDILWKVHERHVVPAMAAAVVSSQGLEKVAAVGTRKWGTDVGVTVDDLWHLGSNTKAITSTLAAILVDQGSLDWNSMVSEVFPELASAFHRDFREVSLVQLLSQVAAVPENMDYDALGQYGSVRDQRMRAVRSALCQKPCSIPGTECQYSNLGYIIVGAMIERCSGMDWESAVARHVFLPLGMSSAAFGGLGTPGQIDQPWGHKNGYPAKENGPDVDNPPVLGPSGRVHCTIQDWAKFIQDQLRGTRGDPALLQAHAYQMLHTPHFGGHYALGWLVTKPDWAGGRLLAHMGSNTLYLALVWIAPKLDLAVMVCTNEGLDSLKAAEEAAGQIFRAADRS
jgi:CubicO group peptidase (beta-lactamase class C family)